MSNTVAFSRTVFALLTMAVTGCASNGNPLDPLEPMNRAIYGFNEAIDRAVFKPIAETYQTVAPRPVQSGVRNFFSNLNDVTVLANDVLQIKVEPATRDLFRVTINSTVGILGLLDVAHEMGLKKHKRDFGQTLGYWGSSSGSYLVLPLYGPSSVRDAAGRLIDALYFDPIQNREAFPHRTGVVTLDAIDTRAAHLDGKRAMDAAALDPYEFSRDLFLEYRDIQINEGRSLAPLE